MTVDRRFEGKVAIVTGAASGIGKALSGALARRGATVVLADIDEVGAKAAAEALHSGPTGRVAGVGLDVTDAGAVADLVTGTAEDHGRLDLLFNNAGIGIGGETRQLSLAHWERAIDVNLRGVIHGVVAAYPVMIRQGRGHIVNTASLAGLLPFPMGVPYGMTKHAVVGLSTGLRIEAARYGVRVSVVCPGVIDTPILDKGNPPDLPPLEKDFGGGREGLSQLGKPYPPERLAEDILAGVARNRAIIVSPRHARVAWDVYRAAPSALIAVAARGLKRLAEQGKLPI